MKRVKLLAPMILGAISVFELNVDADANTNTYLPNNDISAPNTLDATNQEASSIQVVSAEEFNNINPAANSYTLDDSNSVDATNQEPSIQAASTDTKLNVNNGFDINQNTEAAKNTDDFNYQLSNLADGLLIAEEEKVNPVALKDDENIETYMGIINNLMYLDSFRNRALDKTIYQYAQERQSFSDAEVKNMRDFLISEDMDNALFKTALSHPEVYDQIKLVDINTDEDAGATTYLNPDQSGRVHKFTFVYGNDLIIAFAGTAGDAEWLDNFQGAKETDTKGQLRALEYFDAQVAKYGNGKDVYVTGHSKGGNKAMYVGIVAGDRVKHAYSFDGQGFGQPFIKKYQKNISKYAQNLTNISAEDDFVNTLFVQVARNIKYVNSSNGWGLSNDLVNFGSVPGEQFFDLVDLKSTKFILGLYYTRLLGTHAPSSMLEIKNGQIQLSKPEDQNEVLKLVQVFLTTAQKSMNPDDFYRISMLLSGAIISQPDLYDQSDSPEFYTSIVLNMLRNNLYNLFSNPNPIAGLIDFTKGMCEMFFLALERPELFSLTLNLKDNYVVFIASHWIDVIIRTTFEILPNLTIGKIVDFWVDVLRLVFIF